MNALLCDLSRLRAALLALAAALVAGCMAGPDYVRPAQNPPAAYKEAGDWQPAAPRDGAPRGAWWEAYGDPELDALEAQVDTANPSVAIAAAQVRGAQAATQGARAALFPLVSGSASASRGGRASGATTGLSGVGNSYNVALDVNWELDLWGGVRRSVEAAQAAADASAADLAAARLSAQALLAQSYLLLRVQDAEIALLDDTVAAYGRSLQLTQNQYAAGIVSRGDVEQAQAQLKSTQAQALDASVQRAQLEHAIAILVGKAPAELSIAPRPLAAVFPAIPPTLPSTLLERRPDIAGAERRAAAANAKIGVAQAAFYPALSISAQGGFQSSVLSNLISLPARYWSLGPALAQTIFDAGLRQAQKAEAVAAFDQAAASYRATVLTGFQEVEDNLVALRVLAQEAAVQDDAVKAARASLAIANNQYRAGTTSYLTVVVLQAASLNAERSALSIVGRRLTASVGLVKALGGGFEAAAVAAAGH